jgi:hypothetical protein
LVSKIFLVQLEEEIITDHVENGYNQNTEEYLKKRYLWDNPEQNVSARCWKTINMKDRAGNKS